MENSILMEFATEAPDADVNKALDKGASVADSIRSGQNDGRSCSLHRTMSHRCIMDSIQNGNQDIDVNLS